MIMHTNTGKAAWLLCALFAACGDDGTERLSSCPDQRIVTDKMGIIRCAGPNKSNDAGKSAASSSSQGSTAQANRANPADKEREPADKPAANGGAAATSTGNAGKPAAGSSADAPSSSGGSGMPAPSGAAPESSNLPSGGSWYCVQVMNACSCVMGSVASDNCTKPRPTCCVSVKNDASVNTCVCYPEDSTECMGVKQNPSIYPPVSECPPN